MPSSTSRHSAGPQRLPPDRNLPEKCQPITCALCLPVANHVRARFAQSHWRARSACPVGASSLRNKHEAALESRSYEKTRELSSVEEGEWSECNRRTNSTSHKKPDSVPLS
ncbi:hypothetical protein E2C01_028718 [Portunus trituberculatus]|uniref:Uncharacterized protein n=1 Tax=Portunus trituberculatus TaxID=210409 RepID=A0A5B7EPU5_PORTR|nr:hypothetical protein [Portunus trituberculatus]